VNLLLWVVAGAGFVGFAVIESVLVPLIFTLIFAFSRPDRRPKIKETERTIRAALRQGRQNFLQLRQHRDSRSGGRRGLHGRFYDRLPPGDP
jgi:hypothetical protein